MYAFMKHTCIFAMLIVLLPAAHAQHSEAHKIDKDVVLTALNKGDKAAAIRYLEPLAKQGNADAQFMLVSVLQGVDQKQALDWLIAAAKNRHPSACHVLGSMYMEGNGMPQDKVLGEKYLRCAADGGEPGAQLELGMAYRTGGGAGGVRDDEKAAALIRKAADKGNAEAQYRLAEMYRYGYGVKRDPAEAKRLLRAAMAQGHAEANKMLAEMGD
jgi:hypothetical protein